MRVQNIMHIGDFSNCYDAKTTAALYNAAVFSCREQRFRTVLS